MILKTSDFSYILPEDRIAQAPAAVRDACKLLVLDKNTGEICDRVFRDLYDLLEPGDILVANETRVMPARILGRKKDTGGAAELFLLRENFSRGKRGNDRALWEALVRPGRRLKPGAVIEFYREDRASGQSGRGGRNAQSGQDERSTRNGGNEQGDQREQVVLEAEILDWTQGAGRGERLVALSTSLSSINDALHTVGQTPLPPYIKNYRGDPELYQTVYARRERSAAAPTAGLHFTPKLITRLQEKGVSFETVELEVGLDTFRIVEEEDPGQHQIHTETFHVPQKTIDAIEHARKSGGRVVAVGTTSVRCLESAWNPATAKLEAQENAVTSLFIMPGYRFKVVDALVTNFHVPRSTLLMLVSALASHEHIMAAYEHALAHDYRFLSFGDAMFIK